MATSWAQTASEIAKSALEHMGIIAAGETPSADDTDVCLRALNGLMKELPIYGYQWPEYRQDQAITWSSGTPSTVNMPVDFYGFPFLRRSDGVALAEITPAAWLSMDAVTRAQTAPKPTGFYISGSVVTLWPIPTADPGLTANYQSKMDDAVLAAQPDIPQSWLGPLAFGVAYECRLKFVVPVDIRSEIVREWELKRALLLESAAPTALISFSVSD